MQAYSVHKCGKSRKAYKKYENDLYSIKYLSIIFS
jgi:hypothetical protein